MSNEIDWDESDLKEMDTGTDTDTLEIKKDPVSKFVDRKKELGRADSTVRLLENTLTEFEAFLYHRYDKHPCEVHDGDIKAFNEYLKNGEEYYTIGQQGGGENGEIDQSDRSRLDRLRSVKRFYNWLQSNGVVSENPAEKALSDLTEKPNEFDAGPPDRPKIELEEMKEFLQFLTIPFTRAFIFVLLKTGMRRGEVSNLDLRDVHLDHPIYDTILKKHDIELVSEVKNRPDSLYVMPEFTKGSVIRGEERIMGQKRKREDGTVIPIDAELKTALLEYILTRPLSDTDAPCYPFFAKETTYGNTERCGETVIRNHVLSALEEYGWYESGAKTEDKVDNHYFRHYFTHNHRHSSGVYDGYMPEGVIAYIRGDADSGDTSRETVYSHGEWDDWEKTVREPYLDGVYQFDIYD